MHAGGPLCSSFYNHCDADNQVYIASSESASGEQDNSQLTHPQERAYEFDTGYSPIRNHEYAYAEVGPFGEMVSVCSPINGSYSIHCIWYVLLYNSP